MARIKKSLLEEFRGRIGNVVFYQSRGCTYVRQLPSFVHNPRTPLQMIQRNKIGATISFYKTLKHTMIASIWKKAAEDLNMSGYNLFTKCNMGAFDGQGNMADYAKVHFSLGKLPQADCMSLTKATGNEVVVTWKNVTPLSDLRMTDRLMAVVVYVDESFDILQPEQVGARRMDEGVEIRVPEKISEPLGLYLFFADEHLHAFSMDQYFSL